MSRADGRSAGQLRTLDLALDSTPYAEGSCLISAGQTRVLCAVSLQEGVPAWREKSGAGWLTAEYGMLPRATHTRSRRERGGVGGRTQEIQRLIGRSLRSVVDLDALGPRTATVDCDVLQADGGTRTASVTGASIAVWSAFFLLRSLRAGRPDVFVRALAAGLAGVPRRHRLRRRDRLSRETLDRLRRIEGRLYT